MLLRRAAVPLALISAAGSNALATPSRAAPRSSPPRRRRVIYYVACSLDGKIAGASDDISWLGGRAGALPFETKIDFNPFLAGVAYTVSGARTADVVAASGVSDPYPTSINYVLTRNPSNRPRPGGGDIVTSEDPVVLVKYLRDCECEHQYAGPGGASAPDGAVWIVGGGNLAAQLFAAGVIDEVEVFIHPVILGRGVGLAAELLEARIDLTVREVTPLANGIVRVRYDVVTESS
jgi:dihydrofolate reductase